MDIEKLYNDFSIPVAPRGHQHSTKGWVNTHCPFCFGSKEYHLGYCADPDSTYFGRFQCWRCGGHKVIITLEKLLHLPFTRIKVLTQEYGGVVYSKREIKVNRAIVPVSLPPNTKEVFQISGAIDYLYGRNFNAQELEAFWGIKATGPASIIKVGRKTLDYSYRIIVPVYYEGRLVTYLGRDWTGRNSVKYLTADPSIESTPIKEILYGLDKAKRIRLQEGRDFRAAILEGVTDCWRCGPGSVATFGIKFTQQQVRLKSKNFNSVCIMFDSEPQAQRQAQKLAVNLKERGVDAKVIKPPVGIDPGDMDRDELLRLLG